MTGEDKDSIIKTLKAVSIFSGAGIYIACVVGMCLYAGMKADEFFSLSPYGKIGGIVVGFPVAIYTLYRQIKANGIV